MNDGRKRKPQKHQNKTAYKINFDTQALQKQKKVSLTDLCVRCTQQIEWKLQYNKYKKMTEPSRCNICSQRTVYRTYMNACQLCVQLKKICAKCLTPDYEAPSQVKVSEMIQKQQQRAEYNNQIDFMKSLQERSRRTIRRNLEKEKISWDQEQQYFINEQGKKVTGLHFRKGFTIDEDGNLHDLEDEDIMDEDDMFEDDDDMDQDMDEEEKQENQKKTKNKSQNQVDNHKSQKKQTFQKNAKKSAEIEKENGEDKNKSDIEGDKVDYDNNLNFQDDDEDLDDQTEDLQINDGQEENEKTQNRKKKQ